MMKIILKMFRFFVLKKRLSWQLYKISLLTKSIQEELILTESILDPEATIGSKYLAYWVEGLQEWSDTARKAIPNASPEELNRIISGYGGALELLKTISSKMDILSNRAREELTGAEALARIVAGADSRAKN